MNLVAIGKIFSIFGLDGKVKFYSYVEDRDLASFVDRDVWIGQNSRKVIKVKINFVTKMNNHHVMGFLGFDSAEKAKKITGQMMYINETELPALKKDEYYFYQIIGTFVYYEDGSKVGMVKDVIQTGSNDVLVVGDDEVLIPMIKDYILKIDVENNEIVVRKMEWF
jgi:16S rRNA processing protein RimM